MGDYDDDFSEGDYSSDDDYDNFSDEQESDDNYDNGDENADYYEAHLGYPLDDWEDVAMLGAISEEIADERNRRYQSLKEDKKRQKELDKDLDGMEAERIKSNKPTSQYHNVNAITCEQPDNLSSEYQKKNNTKNQAGSAIPKTEGQINNAQNKSNAQGIINFAIPVFVIFILVKACGG